MEILFFPLSQVLSKLWRIFYSWLLFLFVSMHKLPSVGILALLFQRNYSRSFVDYFWTRTLNVVLAKMLSNSVERGSDESNVTERQRGASNI